MVIEQQGEEVDAFKVNQWDKREIVAHFFFSQRGAPISRLKLGDMVYCPTDF